MADDSERSDELLRRARELEARSRASQHRADAEREPTRHAFEGLAWIGRTVARGRRVLGETRAVLAQLVRYSGPLRPIGRGLWRVVRLIGYCASHVRGPDGEPEFSPRRLARSLVAMAALPVLMYAVYNLSTRHSGVFLINDKHLVSGETDEYQIGGCWERLAGQTACEKGEGVIVLVRPSWIPGTGIFSMTYDEDVGLIPLQGRCRLRTYGIYLRLPALPMLRGVLKPIAIGVGDCEGLVSSAEPALAAERALVSGTRRQDTEPAGATHSTSCPVTDAIRSKSRS